MFGSALRPRTDIRSRIWARIPQRRGESYTKCGIELDDIEVIGQPGWGHCVAPYWSVELSWPAS